MSIISISRGSFSHGKEVAQKLAQKLNYTCLSKDVLLEAACKFNIPEQHLNRALHDSPTFFQRLQNSHELYLDYFTSSFLSSMAKDNVVYHGLAGQFYLQDIPHALKVRITADMDDRISEEIKRENCSRQKAIKTIEKDDNERHQWSIKFHGVDTCNSRLYDMVLHIGSLTVEDIVEILVATINKKQFQTTKDSLVKIQKKALLASIKAKALKLGITSNIQLVDDTIIRVSNFSIVGKNANQARRELEQRITNDSTIQKVIFDDPIPSKKDHINTFYNLDGLQ